MALDSPAANNPPDFRIGEFPRETGGFRLLSQLGHGGMGVVYLAEEIASGRRVALKVILAQLCSSQEAFDRFRREAQLAAAVSDPHCVFVYGAHQVDGSPAIAMELCGSESLKQYVESVERVPIETAARWTLEILDGLEAIHSAGVIHRDVKPSNCFTTEDGHVKVGDFGLSRLLESDSELTQSGAFLGSPSYASPEQVLGRNVDARSDLYSCGATLYALLTGRPPYVGKNIGALLARIVSEDPVRPTEIRPDIPPGLERVVLRAMERNPAKRFQDHASFRAALQPFARTGAGAATPARRFVAYMIDTAAVGVVLNAVQLALFVSGSDVVALDAQRPWTLKHPIFQVLLHAGGWAYFVGFEGFRGAGLGKWVLGQRVVGSATGQPTLSRTALRTTIAFAPSIALFWLMDLLRTSQVPVVLWTTFAPLLIWATFFLFARKKNGYRALHDWASGTRVIQRDSPLVRTPRSVPPPLWPVERSSDVATKVGPYEIAGVVAKTVSGRILYGRDADLDRHVWIYESSVQAPGVGDARRLLGRRGRLRWLDILRTDGRSYEVFEAPGGTSLGAFVASGSRMEWPIAQNYLLGLADELCHSSAATSDAVDTRYGRSQVWIDRGWNARILDVAASECSEESLDALQVLAASARDLLTGDRQGHGSMSFDVPARAESLLNRLSGSAPPFESVCQARDALAALMDRPAALTRGSRTSQILLSIAAPVALAGTAVLLWVMMASSVTNVAEGLASVKVVEDRGAATAANPLTIEEDRALNVLISNAFGDRMETQLLDDNPEQANSVRKVYAAAHERYPAPTEMQIEDARRVVHPLLPETALQEIGDAQRLAYQVPAWVVPAMVAAWGLVATVAGFLARGGLTFRLCGIYVRSRKGPQASRTRCAWRATLIWLPLAALYSAGGYLVAEGHFAIGGLIFLGTAMLHVAGIAHALWFPTRSLADRLAGTYLVPR